MSEKEEAVDNGVILSLSELLTWAERNGVILLPCKRKSKNPRNDISTDEVYPDGNAPTPNDSVNDSFLQPTPERIKVIRRYWGSCSPSGLARPGVNFVSASIGMNYPTDDGYTIGCIDVDTDDLFDGAMELDLFKPCPAVRGKKGVKFFFKLATDGETPE